MTTRVLIAPDKFKSSLTAAQVADAVAEGIRVERPDWAITPLPVADAGWSKTTVDTTGPTGQPIRAAYATRGTTAVVELASAVGLDLVITGEGCLDEQSLHGKAPVGVASLARRNGTAVAAVAGRNLLSANTLRASGIHAAYALTDIDSDPAVCMINAAALLGQLGRRIAGDLDALRRTNARQGVPQ